MQNFDVHTLCLLFVLVILMFDYTVSLYIYLNIRHSSSLC